MLTGKAVVHWIVYYKNLIYLLNLQFSLLNKSVVTQKLLHLQYFVQICFPPTFYMSTANFVLYF